MDDRIAAFLEPPHIATVATTMEDGRPQQAVTWYRLDPDGTILVNAKLPRTWPANVLRTGQAYLAVLDTDDVYSWVGLQCELVEVIDDAQQAREDIIALAHRYHPEGPNPESIAAYRTQQRVSFRLRPTRVHDHIGG